MTMYLSQHHSLQGRHQKLCCLPSKHTQKIFTVLRKESVVPSYSQTAFKLKPITRRGELRQRLMFPHAFQLYKAASITFKQMVQ